jgi:RNA processing factor Prp31
MSRNSSDAMDLTKKHFDQIGEYVQENLPNWARKLSLVSSDQTFQKQTLILETELKHQRELMQENFKQIDKRFEQVNKRFEQVDKRFEQVDKRFEEMNSNFNLRFEQSKEEFKNMFNFMKWQTGMGFAMVMGLYIKLFIG